MAIDLTKPAVTKDAAYYANFIRARARQQSIAAQSFYAEMQTLMNNNPDKVSRADIITALGADAALIAHLASVRKATINFFLPGTIVDATPEATITLP